MQRRQLFQFAQNGLLFTASMILAETFSPSSIAQPKPTTKLPIRPPTQPAQNPQPKSAAKTNPSTNLTLQWLGHMSFLSSGSGLKILTHPFKSGGCTAGYTPSKPSVDLALISSRLLDEGYLANLPSDLKVLSEPGAYNVSGIGFQGIRMVHDRLEGRKFGTNVAWLWQQGNVRILHLGGAAAPLLPEQRILMGRPNILILPVGGGTKGYSAQEAKDVVDSLNPQIVIPSHFRTDKSASTCELETLDQFLSLIQDRQINRLNGNTLALTSLPKEPSVVVFKL
jgi:L-ascorbate metabolism protein UlaG (beta-lactamase superfamily)